MSELVVGFYVLAIIILGIVLDEKCNIPFFTTYSWGAAVGFIAQVFIEASTGRGRIDLISVVMALLVTSFAVYITVKRGF